MPRREITRLPNAADEAMKLNALATMRSARTNMLMRFPFMGELSMQLKIVPVLDERLPVACTDGESIFVNAHVVEHPEMAFKRQFRSGVLTGKSDCAEAILAHEVWHCALLHFDRGIGMEPRRFNIACDIEIGYLLDKVGIPNLSDGTCGWASPGMSAEQIYGLLDSTRNNSNPPPFGSGNLLAPLSSSESKNTSASTGTSGRGSNEEKNTKGKAEDPVEKFINGHYSRYSYYPPMRSLTPNFGNKGVSDPDFSPAFNRGEDEADELEQRWHDTVRKVASRHGVPGQRPGHLPANLEKIVNGNRKNKLDWKQILLDFVSRTMGGDRQWLPPARRYAWKKLYIPRRSERQSIELVIAVDTSGSTTEDLPDFLGELRGMMTAFGDYRITIIQCDAKIHSVKEYTVDDPLPETLTFYGFGGTSLKPPFDYVTERIQMNPNLLIYLTDGIGEAPEEAPEYPVIWCLTGEGKKPVTWGWEVRINADDRR